jgi:outer membrane protein OmpA-like peptidoglycan-associated protein
MTRFTRMFAGATLTLALVAPLAAANAQQGNMTHAIIQSLGDTSKSDPTLTADLLRRMARDAVEQNHPLDINKSAIARRLERLAQFTVQIQFALDSAIIRPESYQTLGAMADAMHHPILRNFRFVVVGNTDTTGTRAHNLALSQRRADAIVQALVNLYSIAPNRLEAAGLGQEALQVPSRPTDPINRRVQIFNIGSLGPTGIRNPARN